MNPTLMTDRSPRAAALSYAARGWAVLPLYPVLDGVCGCGMPACKYVGKHPIGALVHRGLHDATTDASLIERWFAIEPDANIAIRTGQASGLVVIDLDDRPLDGREGSVTWRRLLATHAQGRAPETVEAITGGGGRHLYFRAPEGLPIAGMKDTLGPGLEVKAEGGYVVAPGSNHVSGRDYLWESSAHPEDMDIAPVPDWLLALCRTRAPRTETSTARIAVELAPLEAAELRAALACLGSDDRDTWLEVGMALHATGDDATGFSLWDAWSQTSDKYNAKDQRRVWHSFTDRADGVTIASIYARAHRVGWQRPTLEQLALDAGIVLPMLDEEPAADPAPAAEAKPARPERPQLVPARDPLSEPLPGVLEDIARWSLATAAHPVRTYAVAAALAVSSVLCSRRYASDAGNYSSLYLLVVGKSGTGKEHVRTTIEAILRAAGHSALVGPNAFTSSSAVWSAVHDAPQSVAIIDEIGKFLGAASGGSDGAAMKDSVLTTLMELFGRLHTHAQTPQYATLTMSNKQKGEAKRKTIERPALSLVGLTTPSTWYGALKSAQIASGFLNRFLVLEANAPRGDFTQPTEEPVPDRVVAWAKALMFPKSDLDLPGRASEIPPAVRLAIAPEALHCFQQFRRACNRRADALEADALGELPMRAAEQAMRLGLIAALADDPNTRVVGLSHAEWGVALANALLERLIPAVQTQMADSPLHAMRNRFLAAIAAAGARGMTQYEINRAPMFAGAPRRDRDDVIVWAVETGQCAWVTEKHDARGGRPRRALRVFAISATAEVA